tara:strand:+ start:1270 stop:1602 length:333 start_codon:yes stop_codon:yes gene_type:complete
MQDVCPAWSVGTTSYGNTWVVVLSIITLHNGDYMRKKNDDLETLKLLPKKVIAEMILKLYDETYKETRIRIGELLMEDNKKSGLIKQYLKLSAPTQTTDNRPAMKWVDLV